MAGIEQQRCSRQPIESDTEGRHSKDFRLVSLRQASGLSILNVLCDFSHLWPQMSVMWENRCIDGGSGREREGERPIISPKVTKVQGRTSQKPGGASVLLLLQLKPTSQWAKMSFFRTSIHVFHVTYTRVQECCLSRILSKRKIRFLRSPMGYKYSYQTNRSFTVVILG